MRTHENSVSPRSSRAVSLARVDGSDFFCQYRIGLDENRPELHGGNMHQHRLPEIGLLRLGDIIGDPKKGKPAIVPVSRSTWWAGVKSGRYPAGVLIGANMRAWPVSQIKNLVAAMEGAR
jgi:hypothetical protein